MIGAGSSISSSRLPLVLSLLDTSIVHPERERTISISGLRFKISLEKESRTYVPGERIHGSLHIFHIPSDLEYIYGLMIHMEGEYSSGPKNPGVKIVDITEYYFIGSAWKITQLKTGEFKFSITVPKCSPCSFSTEKSSCIKYRLKLVANRFIKGLCTLRNEKCIIISNEIVQKWDNQDSLCAPMFLEMDILNGNIHLELNTNRKCYQPGDEIEFSLKTRNGGDKNINRVSLQLQQNVTTSKQFDKNILVGLNNGPPVPKNSTQIWSGMLEIPETLPPSYQEGSTKNKTIIFQYCLTVTLKTAGSSGTSMSEEFPIQIGCPLVDSWQLRARPRSNSLVVNTPGQFGIGRLMRRMSLISFTPSLPDYRTAHGHSVLPPAYSSLDLENILPLAPPQSDPSPSAAPPLSAST